MEGEVKKTVLYPAHAALGARFTEFGGWLMPVSYKGVNEEHLAVRNNVGLFDVSHMGEIEVLGGDALPFLQSVLTNDIARIEVGRAQYNLLLNENGGVIDDLIVYRLETERYLLCVNAANAEKDFAWLSAQNRTTARVLDRSKDYGQVALQGPSAQALLETLLESEEGALSRKSFPPFTQRSLRFGEVELLIARTGYTGEDGFEIFFNPDAAFLVWDALLELGAPLGIQPIGLGARDTLRLEAALPLHGHELRPDAVAVGAAANWAIKPDKGEFIGRAALIRAREAGVASVLAGFEVVERGIARDGMAVIDAAGRQIGRVTSGTKTPLIERPIGLALINKEYAGVGRELAVDVRGKPVKIITVTTPFYKPKGSA